MPSSERVLGSVRPAPVRTGATSAGSSAALSAPPTSATVPSASTPAATAAQRPVRTSGAVIQARRSGTPRELPAGLLEAALRAAAGRAGTDAAAAPVPPGSPGAMTPPDAIAASGPDGSGLQEAALDDALRAAEARGFEAGFARGQAQLRQAVQAAGALAAQLESLAPQETQAVAQSIAVIATAIARRIVDAELRTDPTILVRSLESAVATINGSPEAHVLLHPDQLEAIRTAWEATHGTAFLGKRWTFEADTSLTPGGCVLRYDHGLVSLGLEAQAQEIANAIADAFPGMPGGSPVIEEDPE